MRGYFQVGFALIVFTVFAFITRDGMAQDGKVKPIGASSRASTSLESASEKWDPIKIGAYAVGLLLSIPIVFVWGYKFLLKGGASWPTTLFGRCAGVWILVALTTFGYLFRKNIPLGTASDPLHGMRLFVLTLILGVLLMALSFAYWRRPAPPKTANSTDN